MAGIIGSMLAGAAQGGGTGVAKAGEEAQKSYDLAEHEKLKNELATERETALEGLRQTGAKELQGTEIASREKEGAAARTSSEKIASEGRASVEKVAGMQTTSAEKIAQLGRDLTLQIENRKATPMIDDRGHVLMIGFDGKPHGYLNTPDGERFKSPSLKAGAKEFAESISHQLAELGRAELVPTTYGDPEAMKLINKRRTELTSQLSQVLSTGEVPKSEAKSAPAIKDPFKGGSKEVAPGDQVSVPSGLAQEPPGTVQEPTPEEIAAAEQPGRAMPGGAGRSSGLIERLRLQKVIADARTNPAAY